MKVIKQLTLGLLAATALGCASGVRLSGSGLNPEDAVVVTGAASLEEQSASINQWIEQNYPGAKLNVREGRYILSRRLVYAAHLDLVAGTRQIVYFDITDLPTAGAQREYAMKVGQDFIARQYPDFNSSNMTLIANDAGDSWEVTYELPKGLLGGAPVVLIDKRSKQVVRSYRTQ